ncbi:MAG TPA: hypothetical protein VIC05_02055 [Solirubrobacteraceae bacterium]
MEVGQEVVVWLYGDDLPVLRPDLLEQREQELASLGRLGLDLPEAGELVEQRFGAVNGRFGGWALALEFFLQGLAAHDVLGLGEVAQDVEVLQAL